MSDFDRPYVRPQAVARPDMAVDAGLRAFMLGVYNKVALGLVLSAALSWVTGNYPPAQRLLFSVDGVGQTVDVMGPYGPLPGVRGRLRRSLEPVEHARVAVCNNWEVPRDRFGTHHPERLRPQGRDDYNARAFPDRFEFGRIERAEKPD